MVITASLMALTGNEGANAWHAKPLRKGPSFLTRHCIRQLPVTPFSGIWLTSPPEQRALPRIADFSPKWFSRLR